MTYNQSVARKLEWATGVRKYKARIYRRVKCSICRKEFQPTNGSQTRCSHDCYLEYERRRSKERRKNPEFCKKSSLRSMRARKAKSEQYRRYTYKWWREKRGTWNTPCEVCGELRNSELAHIIPRKDGGTMDKNNLLVLCPNHHKILDNHIIKNLGNQFTAEEYAKISARVELLIPPRLV